MRKERKGARREEKGWKQATVERVRWREVGMFVDKRGKSGRDGESGSLTWGLWGGADRLEHGGGVRNKGEGEEMEVVRKLGDGAQEE